MTIIDRRRVLEGLERARREPQFRKQMSTRARELARGHLRGLSGVRVARGVHLEGPGEYQLSPGSCIREGARVYVGPGAVLTLCRGAAIGARSVINVQRGVRIGAGSQISWHCQILDTDFHTIYDADRDSFPSVGEVTIGDGVLVGTGAIVLKGVTIGDGAVIGAGSVVSSDVAGHRLVAGNPARDIRHVSGWE